MYYYMITLIDFRKSGLSEVEHMQEDLRRHGYIRSISNLVSIYKKVVVVVGDNRVE